MTGFYQELLHTCLTDSLKATVVTKELPPDMKWNMLKNGSWVGAIGWLHRREVDVVDAVRGDTHMTSAKFPLDRNVFTENPKKFGGFAVFCPPPLSVWTPDVYGPLD